MLERANMCYFTFFWLKVWRGYPLCKLKKHLHVVGDTAPLFPTRGQSSASVTSPGLNDNRHQRFFSVKTRITCWSRNLSAGGASPGLMWETDLAFPPISQHLKNAPAGSADIFFFFKNWINLKTHSRSSWWLLVVGCLVLQAHHWKPEAIEVPCNSKDSWSEEQMDSWAKGKKRRKGQFFTWGEETLGCPPPTKQLQVWVVDQAPDILMCDNLFKYNSGSTPSHIIPKMVMDIQPPGRA